MCDQLLFGLIKSSGCPPDTRIQNTSEYQIIHNFLNRNSVNLGTVIENPNQLKAVFSGVRCVGDMTIGLRPDLSRFKIAITIRKDQVAELLDLLNTQVRNTLSVLGRADDQVLASAVQKVVARTVTEANIQQLAGQALDVKNQQIIFTQASVGSDCKAPVDPGALLHEVTFALIDRISRELAIDPSVQALMASTKRGTAETAAKAKGGMPWWGWLLLLLALFLLLGGATMFKRTYVVSA